MYRIMHYDTVSAMILGILGISMMARTAFARALAFEELEGEVLDVRPRMRQVDGAGVAQLEIMAFANVTGSAQADGGHAGGNGRPDPTGAVFDHETFIRGSRPTCLRQTGRCPGAAFLARPYRR